jgi:predicted NBD/HSP70 family sugar kinase
LGKVSLQDMKFHNRRLILQSIINGKSRSRIALSRGTGLSPSTVTSLVAELLEEKVLIESGITLSTGGRGSRELKINPGYGLIAVVELGRQRANLCIYDMALEKQGEKLLAERRLSGSNLFFEISTAIFEHFYKKDEDLRLAGIGLLFQEDMIESDLNVMFSTSLSADAISLREALYTQFRVPVTGEYSVNEVLAAVEDGKAKNSVHIALSNTALISLTIDGQPLLMNGGKSANITGLLPAFDGGETGHQRPVSGVLAGILALICKMFSLDIILLSGERVKPGGFVTALRDALASFIAPDEPPPIQVLRDSGLGLDGYMARRVRNIVLGAA